MAHGGDRNSAQSTVGQGRRCIICVPPESAPPSRLLTGLSQRHVPVTVMSDAPSVMYDLSLPGGVLALIVVEPDRQPHLADLLAAVRAYYARLPLWQYRAEVDGLTRLSTDEPMPANESTDKAQTGEPAADDAKPTTPAHVVTAADDEDDDEEADDRRALRLIADEPRGPLLTAEELEMLLGPLHEEKPPRS
ncbi:hypothetical protein ACERK3_02115 [Phycisphaerales bacterium AB-hyl4]|uniref:Uncharacterized protein n=1 Tax=Natronomicrosphaera hydrolytica TaxID=3242702 RepID=A0ABV4U0E9_9BACT